MIKNPLCCNQSGLEFRQMQGGCSPMRPPPSPSPSPLPPTGGRKMSRSQARRILQSSTALMAAFDKEGVCVFPAAERLRRQQGSKEVLKRALSPPRRRPSLRWRNFQPRPSPLSSMSTAQIEIAN